jgi:hypothetical protein
VIGAGDVVVGAGAGAVGVVVEEVDAAAAVAGAGADVVGVATCVVCFGVVCPPAKAATVPPTEPITTASAIDASTIRCLMRGMLRPAHQPLANAPANSPVDPGSLQARASLVVSLGAMAVVAYTRRRTTGGAAAGVLSAAPKGRTWISTPSKPSVS